MESCHQSHRNCKKLSQCVLAASKLSKISRTALARSVSGIHFTQTSQSPRGGMVERVYVVRFPQKTIRAWAYEMPNGKLEQFQVAVAG